MSNNWKFKFIPALSSLIHQPTTTRNQHRKLHTNSKLMIFFEASNQWNSWLLSWMRKDYVVANRNICIRLCLHHVVLRLSWQYWLLVQSTLRVVLNGKDTMTFYVSSISSALFYTSIYIISIFQVPSRSYSLFTLPRVVFYCNFFTQVSVTNWF